MLPKQLLIILATLAILATAWVTNSYVTSCVPVIGGKECGNGIRIDKTVLNPQTNTYVTNLGENDFHYQEGDLVYFHITVTNTTNQNISSISVRDILPKELILHASSDNANNTGATITFTINALKQHSNKTLTLITQIAQNKKLKQQKLDCIVNKAITQTASSKAGLCIIRKEQTNLGANPITNPPVKNIPIPTSTPQKITDKNTSQKTIKGNLPIYAPPHIKTNPPTGPALFPLFGLIPTSALGFFLRKKSKK